MTLRYDGVGIIHDFAKNAKKMNGIGGSMAGTLFAASFHVTSLALRLTRHEPKQAINNSG